MKCHRRTLIATAVLLSVAPGAFAQAQATSTAPQKVDKIEVTGSNIKRIDTETSSNIQVLTKDDILKSGVNTIAELLREVPSIGGGALQDYDGGSGFSRSTSSASLRNLGSIGTLVLLNGRRVAPAANADPNTGQGQSYNLNTIPVTALERIEILKDGASAIYGSDAIAGVINFILRKDYKGTEFAVTGAGATNGEFKNQTVTATSGFGDLAKDRYNVLFSGEYFRRDEARVEDAQGVQDAAYATLASRNILSSSITQIPNYYRESVLGNGIFNVTTPTDPRCPAAQTVSANSGCRINPFQYVRLLSEAERAGFLVKGTYEFSPTLQGTAEISFTRAENLFIGTPPTHDATGNGSIWFNRDGQRFQFKIILPVGHPDNPRTVPVGIRYRFVDLGITEEKVTNDAKRALFGLSGVIGSWDWESAFLYSQTERKEVANGRLHFPTIQAAIANRTYRFGGTNDPALLAALNPWRTSTGETDITSLDLKGSRELWQLPGGPAAVAVGAEIRRESFDIVSDPRQVAGEFVGIASTTVGASRNVQSIFAELSAPIAKGVETQLAFRHDHYSDYGNSTTPKVGIKWNALKTLALRANYAEAFRAPSLTQTSTSRVQSFSTITDPVRCPNGTTPAPGGDTIDCTGRTVASIFLPVANLQPETSKSWTLGAIFSPWDNVSLTADLWEIRRKDQIDRFSAQQVINAEFVPGFTGGSLVRNSNPASFLIDTQGNPIPGTGPIETTTRRFLNLGETRVKGVDLNWTSRFKVEGGSIRLVSNATYLMKYLYQVNKGDPFFDNAGNFLLFESPKLRANATLGYTRAGQFDVFARVNHVGGWQYGDPTVASGCYLASTSLTLAFLGRCQVRAWRTIDIGADYRGLKNWYFSAVVRNIENKKAPYDPNQTTLGFNPTYHNPQGSNMSLTARYTFR
ncbi:MAG: TonB-dependent receptor [Betaproteobacteria bacterium]|nr:TonB-dependent receptor [Betaproteobacteria bacterium]